MAGKTGGSSGDTLIEAVESRDHEAVKSLIAAGADVNRRDKRGRTAVLVAVRQDDTAAVRLLIKSGADVNKTCGQYASPLTYAAQHCHNDCVKLLIKAGADVNTGSNGSALRRAVESGNSTALHMIIEAGDYVNFNPHCLTHAAGHGFIDCVKLLVKAGADVNYRDSYRCTAVMMASTNGHEECVKELIRAGADVNIVDHYGGTPLLKAVANNHDKCAKHVLKASKTKSKSVALIEAASRGRLRYVNMLIENGANVNYCDTNRDTYYQAKDNDTALALAMQNGHTRSVKSLLEAGAIPTAEALIAAVNRGKVYHVKLFIEKGAGVNSKDKDNETALMTAARKQHIDCIEVLIKSGANVNAINKNKDTALLLCASNAACVNMLLKAGAKVNVVNKNKDTALLLGASNASCVNMLLKAGANVNVVNREGYTALAKAVLFGMFEAVVSLVKAGADVNITVPQYGSILSCAFATRKLKFLLLHGAHVNIPGTNVYRALGLYVQYALRTDYFYRQNFQCEKFMLFYAAGERVDGRFSDEPMTILEALDKYVENDTTRRGGVGKPFPDAAEALLCLEQLEIGVQVRSLLSFSREAVRNTLLDANPHSNMFTRIPKLGLPSMLCDYVLYNVSLDDDDEN